MGPSTCCLCAWHGVYQAEKKIIKKRIEPYLFMSRLTLVLLSILVTNIKKNTGRGKGGYVRLTGLQLLFRMRL